MGPSTEPCGTSVRQDESEDRELPIWMNWVRFERYEWNHESTVPWMPNEDWSLFRRMKSSIVLNPALRSRDTSTVDMPWSIDWKILSRVRSKAVSGNCICDMPTENGWNWFMRLYDLELVVAAVALRYWKCYLGWKWVCNRWGLFIEAMFFN